MLVQLLLMLVETALHYFQLSIESFFKKSIQVRQRGLIRLELFLPGDGAIALRDSLVRLPGHVWVTTVRRTLV